MSNFEKLANEKVVIFDGAMGTTIQKLDLPTDFVEINEMLCISAPKIVTHIHRTYFEAGADIAVTNTFGANKMVLAEYGLAHQAAEINAAAVKCAKQATEGLKDKFVALSVGPGSRLPTLGQISYDDLYKAYYEQINIGSYAGADIIIIETCQDLLQMKTAVAAAIKVNEDKFKQLPIIVSFTVEENRNLLVGTDIQCVATVLSHYPIFALGINCGFGPDKMTAPLAELAKHWKGRMYLSSNAGMPMLVDGKAEYLLSPNDFATQNLHLAKTHKLFAVGGCCGTNNEHIAALAENLKGIKPSHKPHKNYSEGLGASAYNVVTFRQTPPPMWVGERANATGCKSFRELLAQNNYQDMINIARGQESAHVIDLSVALSGRDEAGDMAEMAARLNSELTVPIMIDSTSDKTILAALKSITGKPIINSVNFEDGGVKLHKIFPMIKYHPAAVVGLTIDEDGMAQTVESKLFIARRICQAWMDYGYNPKDLFIDFLTFSVTSGDRYSRFAAINTLEAIRLFKQEQPEVNAILGVSNVSYGLPPASRAILNSVFLHKAVKAGLDAAIVHAEKIVPISSIKAEDAAVSDALLNGDYGALDKFLAHFANFSETAEEIKENLSPAEKLHKKVLKGETSDLEPIIHELLIEKSAADILNDILMPAMQQVGENFGAGKLLLPFVLKSAEVMKQSGDILMPHMQSGNISKRGKIVLATVKGDVHDIGKNLVDIILSGNGYEVINMGTKVGGADIVRKAKEVNADAIGMSGLLVKSVEIMKENIELIRDADLNVKVLLGGAALGEDYVSQECAPIMPGHVFYCKDAFSGIEAMTAGVPSLVSVPKKPITPKVINVTRQPDVMSAVFTGRSGAETVSADEFIPFLGKKSLFEGKWGHREGQTNLSDMEKKFNDILDDISNGKIPVEAAYLWGFYPVEVRQDAIWLYGGRFFAEFPRMENGDCIADLYRTTSGKTILPVQLVTLGSKVVDYLTTLHMAGKYSGYYEYHSFFAELADALASYVNHKLTSQLIIDGLPAQKLRRFSFGYPLCPDLGGNKTICELLNSEEIGVKVSETFQMEPIYTTCAILTRY